MFNEVTRLKAKRELVCDYVCHGTCH